MSRTIAVARPAAAVGMKLGLGAIVLGVIAYFVGGPELVMSLFSGAGTSPQAEAPIEAGTPAG